MIQSLMFGSGASACKDFDGIFLVCSVAMQHGIRQFDTAPSYRTEELISSAVQTNAREFGIPRDGYVIQTKIDPIQMYNGNVEAYFKNKLDKLELDYVDALLVHWPVKKYFMETWDSMLKLKEGGYVRKIGICNLRIEQLLDLQNQGIVPEILQLERHPLCTFIEEVRFCVENNIILQDYSPLCKMNPRIKENVELQEIARKYNRDIGQIILRWHIETGGIPIFTSTKPERITLYSKIEDFSLSREEIETISSMNCNHKLYLESLVCPGF